MSVPSAKRDSAEGTKASVSYGKLAAGIALLWGGVAIGATCIATPAKFLAPSLSLSTALEVGRATFYWSGVAEIVLCALFLLSLVSFGGIQWKWALLPVLFLAIQRIGLMPLLDERALQVIKGAPATESHLHTLYIYLEAAKCFALVAIGFLGSMLTSAPLPKQTREKSL